MEEPVVGRLMVRIELDRFVEVVRSVEFVGELAVGRLVV